MCLRGWRRCRQGGGLLRSRTSNEAEKEAEYALRKCLTVPLSDHPVLLAEVLQPRDRERMGSLGRFFFTSLRREEGGGCRHLRKCLHPGNGTGLTEERFSKCATTSFFQEPLAE